MTTVLQRATAQGLYDEFNAKFFGGRLPRYRVVESKGMLDPCYGQCLDDRKLIRIQAGLDADTLRRTLLHEMCHVRTPGFHGRRFQEKLRRLAAQGETWAQEEADMYRDAPTWNEQMAEIAGNLDDIVRHVVPTPTFLQALRLLARSRGMTSRQLLTAAPWLRYRYRKGILIAAKHD